MVLLRYICSGTGSPSWFELGSFGKRFQIASPRFSPGIPFEISHESILQIARCFSKKDATISSVIRAHEKIIIPKIRFSQT